MALGFFTPSSDPNVDMETRKKIAMAMLMRSRKAFPKNLGEGIASVGQDIGDYLAERSLLEQNAAENKAADEFRGKYTGITPQATVAPIENRPPESTPPAAASVAPPTPPIIPAPPPRSRVVTPAPIPPPNGQLGNRGDTVFPTPANGLTQPQASPPAAVPVMAQGGVPAAVPPVEENRRAIGHALLRQQMGGAQPPAPAVAPPPPSVADYGQPSVLAATPPQAIPAAPPQPQVRAMPPPLPQVAQGPQIVDPGPEPTLGRTMTDLQRQILQDLDKEPPARRANARAAVEPILQREQAIIDRENAIIKQKHDLWTARIKTRDEQTFNAPKTAAETAKMVQEIEKGKEPTLREDVETKLIYNPETKQYEPPKIAGADPNKKPVFKGTEFQGKGVVNLGRAQIAHEGLTAKVGDGSETGDEALANSKLQSALSSLPMGAGRSLRSEAYKEADTYAENFVQGFVRQQSGGAFTDSELEKEARSMLPRYGDPPRVVQAKREQREQFLNGLYGVIGSSGQKGLDIDAAKREAKRQAIEEREREAKATKPDAAIPEFKNEAEAIASRLPSTTRIRINGRLTRMP